MAFDAHKNFAYSTVSTAPSPPTTGTSLVVASGAGAKFPAAPFNATVWPAGAQPTDTNAEVVRVTAKSVDTFTIVRQQEGSSARSIGVGDQITAAITAKTLTDIEGATLPTLTMRRGSGAGNYTITSTTYVDVDATNLAFTVTVPTGQKIVIHVALASVHGSAVYAIALTDTTTLLQDMTALGSPSTTAWMPVALSYIFVGDGNSHTFKIRAKVASGTLTIENSSATASPVMDFWMGPAN